MSLFRRVLQQSTVRFNSQKCLYEKVIIRNLAVDVNNLRRGMVIELENKFYAVQSRDHSNTGRGSARIKVELAQVGADKKRVESFRPGETFEVIKLKHDKYQFLYQDDTTAHLLNPETLEELSLSFDYFTGDKKHYPFLEGGMEIIIDKTEDDQIVCFRLPATAAYTVASVGAGAGLARQKGVSINTATLENGFYLTVPDFIKSGEKIIVDLQTLKYSSRASLNDFRLNTKRTYHYRSSSSEEPFMPLPKEADTDKGTLPGFTKLLQSPREELESYLTYLNKTLDGASHSNARRFINDLQAETFKQFGINQANKIVSDSLGRFLYLLTRLIRPKRVLEIGTMTGYSANWILYGMAEEEYDKNTKNVIPPYDPDMKVTKKLFKDSHLLDTPLFLTCDVDHKSNAIANYYFDWLNLHSVSVRPVIMDSLRLLKLIPDQTEFDLIFVDGAKKDYSKIYEEVISRKLLSPSGLMIFDNVLFRGEVAQLRTAKSTLSSNPKLRRTKDSSPDPNPLRRSKELSLSLKLYDFNQLVSKDQRTHSMILPIFDGVYLIQRSTCYRAN